MATSALLITILNASIAFSPTVNLFKVGAGFSNSPGLSCRTITIAPVYEQPSVMARVLGRTQNFIAVTGGEVNGFVPMVTGRGIRGWVQTTETTTGKVSDLRGPCVVQKQPDGRLLFGWP